MTWKFVTFMGEARKTKTYQLRCEYYIIVINKKVLQRDHRHKLSLFPSSSTSTFRRLNMPHDDDKKCEKYRANGIHKTNIMSRMLDHNTHPWSWSNCSKHFVTEFVE